MHRTGTNAGDLTPPAGGPADSCAAAGGGDEPGGHDTVRTPGNASSHQSAGALAPMFRLQEPPRRVMFFGKSMSRTRATAGLVEGLRFHGLEVRWLKLAKIRRWLGRAMTMRYARQVHASFRPDVVFVFCRDLPLELLEEFSRCTTTVIWVEEPLDRMGVDYAEYLSHAHVAFLTNPSKFDWLRAHGVQQTAFVMEGFSSTWHYPVPAPRRAERDLVFIGGPGREGRRAQFLAEIARHHDLQIFGKDWGPWRRRYPHLDVRDAVGPRRYRQLCASSRIVLGLNQVNADPLYFSNRTLFTLACRGFHLTHYVPRLESVFGNGEHLVWYRDLDECIEKVAHYLGRPEERRRIAAQGHEYVVREHQFRERIRYILGVLRTGVRASPEAAADLQHAEPQHAEPQPVARRLTAAPAQE